MWPKTEGIVMAVDHEPLSFLRRAGYAGTNESERFELRHAEETIRKASENGVNALRAHFYKGTGYEVEREERERIKDLSKLCRKYGVHLQLYIQFGTISYETMRAEQPNVLEWVQKDKHGTPITLVYGHQSFRYYPCFNSPGYWNYLENIIRDGIENYDPDMIGLDNITTGEEPGVCHCENCRKAFTGYLKAKYDVSRPEGRKLCTLRFGHDKLDYILPPEWNYFDNHFNLKEIVNPIVQEWVLFRLDSSAKIIRRICLFAKSVNPNVLVEINSYKMFGVNTSFINGIYLPDYIESTDMFWNECDPHPNYADNGKLWHRIRSYKMGHAYNKTVCTTSRTKRGYAESMAFNHGIINGVEQLLNCAYKDMSDVLLYRSFRKKNEEIFAAAPIGLIAVYESRESLSFSNYDVWYADILMQNLLLSRHIPYDLIFDTKALSRYSAVILPDMRCLSDNDIEMLLAFALAGGTLLATGESGGFDEWHRKRGSGSLRERLGIPALGYHGLYTHTLGGGTVLWCPVLDNDKPFREEDFNHNPFKTGYLHVLTESWIPPHQSDLLADALRRHVNIPVDIDAPGYIVSEITRDDKHLYVHLINFKNDELSDSLTLTCPSAVSAVLLDADTGSETVLTPVDGRFSISSIKVYSIVKLYARK